MSIKGTLTGLLLLTAIIETYAQSGLSATGGKATGSGGVVGYTIGQTIYTSATGSGGVSGTGVQQPFLISVLTSSGKSGGIDLEGRVYPNPVSEILYLKIADIRNQDLSYKLYDFSGILLQDKRVESTETTISMHNQAPGTYILKVFSGNDDIKTFRIIKKQ